MDFTGYEEKKLFGTDQKTVHKSTLQPVPEKSTRYPAIKDIPDPGNLTIQGLLKVTIPRNDYCCRQWDLARMKTGRLDTAGNEVVQAMKTYDQHIYHLKNEGTKVLLKNETLRQSCRGVFRNYSEPHLDSATL